MGFLFAAGVQNGIRREVTGHEPVQQLSRAETRTGTDVRDRRVA